MRVPWRTALLAGLTLLALSPTVQAGPFGYFTVAMLHPGGCCYCGCPKQCNAFTPLGVPCCGGGAQGGSCASCSGSMPMGAPMSGCASCGGGMISTSRYPYQPYPSGPFYPGPTVSTYP
jgi:hypothetical protein